MVSVGLETGSFEVGSNTLQVTVQWTVGPTSNAEVTLDHPMRAVYFPTIVNHCLAFVWMVVVILLMGPTRQWLRIRLWILKFEKLLIRHLWHNGTVMHNESAVGLVETNQKRHKQSKMESQKVAYSKNKKKTQ